MMRTEKIIFALIGVIAGITLFKKATGKSNFVDEEASDMTGVIEVKVKPMKTRVYRPNSWVQLGEDYLWVDAKGNLLINS